MLQVQMVWSADVAGVDVRVGDCFFIAAEGPMALVAAAICLGTEQVPAGEVEVSGDGVWEGL
jgi:hypothetical protein